MQRQICSYRLLIPRARAGIVVNANDFELVVPSDFEDVGVPAPRASAGAPLATPLDGAPLAATHLLRGVEPTCTA